MLFVARQARVANRYAPRQTQRVNAESRTLGLFGADMVLWLDPYRSTIPVGSTINQTPDCSYVQGNTIFQTTAAKRPLSSVNSNGGVKGYLYDGVDDGLLTSTLALASTQKLTVAFLSMQGTLTTDVSMAEISDSPNKAGTMAAYRTSSLATRAPATLMYENAGTYEITTSSTAWAANVWLQETHTLDRTQAVGSQLKLYGQGALLPATTTTGMTFQRNFSDYPWYLGWRGSGAGSLYFSGTYAQMIALKRVLSVEEIRDLYRLLYEIAGLAW